MFMLVSFWMKLVVVVHSMAHQEYINNPRETFRIIQSLHESGCAIKGICQAKREVFDACQSGKEFPDPYSDEIDLQINCPEQVFQAMGEDTRLLNLMKICRCSSAQELLLPVHEMEDALSALIPKKKESMF